MSHRGGRYGRVEIAARFTAHLPKVKVEVKLERTRIAEETTFIGWVETLPDLRVDGMAFDLRSRPAMRWVYEQLPSTRGEAARRRIVLMKCSQVGFTVMEILWVIFFALKYDPVSIGMFLPDATLARAKSKERFMPVVRSVPPAVEALQVAAAKGGRPRGSEGNVMTRQLGGSDVRFLHTTGRAATESFPMDVVSFDEVQEMLVADMEKVLERLSGRDLKFVLMGSTANWPDSDIHFWYQRGSCHRLHTRCPTCAWEGPLDDHFPQCIGFDEAWPNLRTGVAGEYRYRCPDGHWIDDPQVGTWKPDNPDEAALGNISIHFHQMLSPTVSAREMIEAWHAADDRKNFYNRKLGKPWQDPSLIPVTLAHLNKCAEAGMALGLTWKKRARSAFMGIDQMGGYNVVVVKERLEDGRQAIIHVEEIYSADPFRRCDKLMEAYGVAVCVVEQNPNFNDAQAFAARHQGRVFLANSFGELADAPFRWNDGPRLDASERRTAEEVRTRYTVSLDQAKCMSLSLGQIVDTNCLFPDPQALTQQIIEKGERRAVTVLKERFFLHLQRVALVTERVNENERKYRRKVHKVGIDPHFAFANMLCDVAYWRAHNRTQIFVPDAGAPITEAGDRAAQMGLHGLPAEMAGRLESQPDGTCGRCIECPVSDNGPPAQFFCNARQLHAAACDPGCDFFVSA